MPTMVSESADCRRLRPLQRTEGHADQPAVAPEQHDCITNKSNDDSRRVAKRRALACAQWPQRRALPHRDAVINRISQKAAEQQQRRGIAISDEMCERPNL